MIEIQTISVIKYCECGCGQVVKNRFVSGHNGFLNKGQIYSEEAREKNRQWHLGKEPGNKGKKYSDKQKENIIKYWNNPESKKKKSEETKRLWKNQDYRNSHLNSGNSEILKELWKTEQHRNKMLKARKDSKTNEKITSSIKKIWDNPEYKARLKKKLKEVHNTPEYREAHSGENHWAWNGGSSFEPYNIEFNNQLKEFIRKRDNYQCQECFIPQSNLDIKLHVHHIDYDKENCSPDNLISLCNSCHVKTSFKNREKWTKHFRLKIFEKINNILISYLPGYELSKQAA